MTVPAIRHIGFLTPGNYRDEDPLAGLEDTLRLFALGEELGFDSAWVRQRHLEPGISSGAVFLAAAAQRTSRIALGTAVIQMGYENPFRLAEDLSMADVLSRGRLNIGVSASTPLYLDLLGPRILGTGWESRAFTHAPVAQLVEHLRGAFLGEAGRRIASAAGSHRPRLRPHAAGLADRVWYGAGSLGSARWAGENGLNLLLGSLTSGEGTDSLFEAQLAQVRVFRDAAGPALRPGIALSRIALGRVILPLDSASAGTRRKYQDYAASRHARTLVPQGERHTLFGRDIVGTGVEILEALRDDPVMREVGEFRLELPYGFEWHEYAQILGDFVTHIAPGLGWGAPTAGPSSRMAEASP
ncbi:LLM class flavin-dependent oxidoreductase (plasmid) [Roseomonas gilardii subsp. gilardii]|uniref:LLM class flavin-dependent oxidoreductase n=1 Tax=Roseomonas gilardii TaxID=257708 RepID=UPI001FF8DD05|nr:LLM class flavin-dependent oxidoreductase [Roseomonas gilardii]UPG74723.1 LLM class flavin-dependent oxidoreductase [Roseomonas gilardii subsp. gilardii]